MSKMGVFADTLNSLTSDGELRDKFTRLFTFSHKYNQADLAALNTIENLLPYSSHILSRCRMACGVGAKRVTSSA